MVDLKLLIDCSEGLRVHQVDDGVPHGVAEVALGLFATAEAVAKAGETASVWASGVCSQTMSPPCTRRPSGRACKQL